MTATPWGFRDILPEEAQAREEIALTVKGCFREHHYLPVETPLLEDKGSLEEGGRIADTPFKLFDDDGRLLVVRPDNTLPIVRLVSTRMRAADLPLRLRYEAPVVRECQRNAGGSRQFTQLGFELIGAGDTAGDVEIVSLVAEAVRELTLPDARIIAGSVRPFKELLAVCEDRELAAEALRKAAQERGVTIKVETNGAVGVNDELESDEIAAADCIIIAADKGVSMARFVGKRLVTVSAGDAVRNADAVLNKALNSKVPVYRGGNAFRTSDWRELGRETYRHLMNGISYMIPFVVVGGVMIALSLLLAQMGLAQKYCDLLNNIGKEAFVLIYPVLAAFIAVSIGDAPAFMPGLMGGYMARRAISSAGCPPGSGVR